MTAAATTVRAEPSVRVFLSYVHEDATLASAMKQALEGHGLRVTLDSDIAPGQSISDFVLASIRSADAVVALLSERSYSSIWTSVELAAALSAQESNPDKKLIPVLVGNRAKLPPILSDVLAIRVDGSTGLDKTASSIVDAIGQPTYAMGATLNVRELQVAEQLRRTAYDKEQVRELNQRAELTRSLAHFAELVVFWAGVITLSVVVFSLVSGRAKSEVLLVAAGAGGTLAVNVLTLLLGRRISHRMRRRNSG